MASTARHDCVLFLVFALLPAAGGGQARPTATSNDSAIAASDRNADGAVDRDVDAMDGVATVRKDNEELKAAMYQVSAASANDGGNEESSVNGKGDLAPADWPDAPTANPEDASTASFFGVTSGRTTGNPAKKLHRVIQPDEVAEPLSSGDKMELAIMSRFTPGDLVATLFSAGWSQVRNTNPHYGTDSGAFGERLGGLALKQTTQSIFNYGIYDSMFHDDPRYYVMGPDKSPGVRALYSASCVFITQKDSGKTAVNWPKFAAVASATALTTLYYPPKDHGFVDETTAFGLSLWTSVLNNEIHEFVGDGIRLLRHNRQ